MDLAGTEQAGACGWALNEGFKSGTTSKRESEMTKLFPNVSLSDAPLKENPAPKSGCKRRLRRCRPPRDW